MKKLNKISACLIALTMSAAANAGTVISSWGYVNEAGFANVTTGNSVNIGGADTTLDPNYNPTASTGAASPTNGNNWVLNSEDNLYYDLGTAGYVNGDSNTGTVGGTGPSILSTGTLIDNVCWGTGPSCLSFTDASGNDTSRVTGSATTSMYGGLLFNQGTQMTHSNLPTGIPSLTSIDLFDGLELASADLIAGTYTLPELKFDIIFNETFNNAGSLFPYAPDDAFIVDLTGGGASAVSGFGIDFIDFTVAMDLTGLVNNGYHTDYQVTTRLSGLQVISIPGGATFGLITPENLTSTLNAQFAVEAVNVPEPATLTFFGLTLLGLAGFRKISKK
ncbi:PEP-CTERM sorting domain-containing protein [Flavobacterium sp. W21_SRS_FM6]|uniref:PEP-CTERM sorting domain-containing protein n=1 Tax=Flavobacterium sp. W21_SRS_FM6 TaxID=3240268 RepID=UPI003F93DC95